MIYGLMMYHPTFGLGLVVTLSMGSQERDTTRLGRLIQVFHLEREEILQWK
jgi:hypothetical protein